MDTLRESQVEVRNGRLWFATLGSPIAWALHLVLCYPLVGMTCRVGSTLALWLVSLATLLVCLASLLVAWFEARRLPAEGDEVVQRGRFMARGGFWMGVLFLVVIIAETLPIPFHDPCQDFRTAWLTDGLWRAAALLLGALGAATAHAHPLDTPLTPGEVLARWWPDPFLVVALAVGAGGYVRGLRTLWRRAGVGRGVTRARATAFAAGVLALALALLSPLDALATALFSAHMLQHLLLMLVAAPLLVLGLPGYTLLWAVPLRARRALARAWNRAPWLRAAAHALGAPLAAVTLHAVAVWGWHLPSLYVAALESDAVHALEHASFLGTALLFWWRVRASAGSGVALLCVFVTAMHSGMLGLLISLAPTAWYPVQGVGAPGWGLTTLEDQQLAGLIMWVPGNLVYLGATLALLVAWLRAAERRTRQPGVPARPEEACLPVDARPPPGHSTHSGSWPRSLVLLLLLAAGAGCRESAGAASSAAPTLPSSGPLSGTGRGGLYRFELELRPERPAVGELFEVILTVREAGTAQPVSGASVALDATMPEHAHGMMTAPEQTELGAGRYLVQGMKLHMPGRWRFHARAAHAGREDELALDYEQRPRALP
jgi:putative membrane protein